MNNNDIIINNNMDFIINNLDNKNLKKEKINKYSNIIIIL